MARWNLKGWNFTEWFLGNGKTIKEILKVAVPAIIAYLATSSPTWTVFATLVGKLILDTAEYYIKE
jgi:hypothetical protein